MIYKAFLSKGKKGKIKANFIYQENNIFDSFNLTNLNVIDFFGTSKENIDTIKRTSTVRFVVTGCPNLLVISFY